MLVPEIGNVNERCTGRYVDVWSIVLLQILVLSRYYTRLMLLSPSCQHVAVKNNLTTYNPAATVSCANCIMHNAAVPLEKGRCDLYIPLYSYQSATVRQNSLNVC